MKCYVLLNVGVCVCAWVDRRVGLQLNLFERISDYDNGEILLFLREIVAVVVVVVCILRME